MRREYEQFLEEAQSSAEYWAQIAILDFTEEVCRLMSARGVKRSELAKRIGSKPSYITKVLRGNANFTLTSMTKLARALDSVVRIHLAPSGVVVHWDHEHTATALRAIDDPFGSVESSERSSLVTPSSWHWSEEGIHGGQQATG